MKGEKKKLERLARQQKLLAMFEGDFYQEKKVGNEWCIKSYNGGTGRWQVSIFSEISYKKYKSYERDSGPMPEIKPSTFERPTLESIKKLVNN